MLMNQRVIVSPWDPYCANEPNREEVGTVHLSVENASGVIGRVTFSAVLLPSQDKFSSSSAFHQAAGVYKWNDMQGFYFYRNDRLVDFGGWSHMRAKDEKSKFLRIAVDYTVNPAMDEEMDVNVSKQTASIPAASGRTWTSFCANGLDMRGPTTARQATCQIPLERRSTPCPRLRRCSCAFPSPLIS